MDMRFDKTTGKANIVIEKDLASAYREAIEKIMSYLSLELFKYNRISSQEIPKDVSDKALDYVRSVKDDFIDRLVYYHKQKYINFIDYKKIYRSFHETIAQLEDIYIYKTIYRRSSDHCGDWIRYDEEYEPQDNWYTRTGVMNVCSISVLLIKIWILNN